jgi:hypothetical protein
MIAARSTLTGGRSQAPRRTSRPSGRPRARGGSGRRDRRRAAAVMRSSPAPTRQLVAEFVNLRRERHDFGLLCHVVASISASAASRIWASSGNLRWLHATGSVQNHSVRSASRSRASNRNRGHTGRSRNQRLARPTLPFSVSVSARGAGKGRPRRVPHKYALQQGERKTCRLLRFK